MLIIHKIGLVFASLMLMVCLAGCTRETTAPHSSQTPAVTAKPTTPDLPEQNSSEKQVVQAEPNIDNIDWDDFNDPLVSKAMTGQIKASVAAIVNRNVEQLHQAIGKDLGNGYDYLLEHNVQFTKVSPAYRESGRIVVPVEGKRTDNDTGEVSEASYVFYFVKGQNGVWTLGSID